MAKFTIGIDFGTLSGRAVIVNTATGAELGYSVFEYPHGVMDEQLPDGTKLPMEYALQHPQDYIDTIKTIVPDVINKAGVNVDDVIGLALDFTACSVLPVKADGSPVCFMDEYKSNPKAYVMMWKHHGANDYADRMTEIASARGEDFLARMGGKISSESLTPRIWQICEEDPKLYAEMDYYLEAGDWMVWQLTGKQTRNSAAAGYKALYHKENGYPSPDFYASLNPELRDLASTKLNCPVTPVCSKAGEIDEKGAALTGLKIGTTVAVSNIDAHAGVPAAMKESGADAMVMIMGTSACQMINAKEEHIISGVFGVVEDGMFPGFFGYEAGQSCVGDHFAWFVDNCVPEAYAQEAREKGIDLHQLLTEKANIQAPGESGLIALDWWNGNRSVLIDPNLTGMMIGMNLQTKPEEMYRALIEATAYGVRKIVDNFDNNGVKTKVIYATGGIAFKNPMMMQIYADVLNRPIKLAGSDNGPALGSAIHAAVAAGSAAGGYDSIFDATRVLASERGFEYTPIEKNVEIYDKLYAEYDNLHEYFGRGANDVMKRLRKIKSEVK